MAVPYFCQSQHITVGRAYCSLPSCVKDCLHYTLLNLKAALHMGVKDTEIGCI